ncbi:MAG: hypothetical protein A3D74_03950 [Candidatus Levybacteria bacterium RIFCSPHIGHO2_02_FULL_37_13]|nr:MAG: hypothetical protein A3D74_03950 [Candidatus Levybacteria bacterium RIFCSPHIGHO2_02_FULL_37_13]OGH29291.1 MAG: hypothetical protein A3E40_00055 [Candidatus Levybacteria bacterium RIFCSPHIGHO2_12_FULL_37_9]OGH39602.1 MAG: hypothetical protein A3B41_01960 [Candidatus Levybacteria bacterium RIFCSPLOWO2_01_FULL_37_26]
MKIGVLTEIINYHSGARAPLMIAKGLAKRGHKVTVFAYDFMLDQPAFDDLKKSGVEIVLIQKKKVKYIGKYLSSISLFKSLKTNPPDAVWFSGTLPFFFAAKLAGIPIVRMYQGTQFNALLENKNPNEKNSLKDALLNTIANWYIYLNDFISFRLSNSVVAISKFAAKEGETLYKKKCDDIIYHGTTFLPKVKSSVKKQKNSIKILSVSRITPYKGFHLILEAVKKVKTKKNILVTIAGSQAKHHYVEYLKKVGGDNIKIVLDPSDLDLAKLYQEADFCVVADRFLYFGLSIYEAAFFGKPTISLNNAAASEIIDHGKTGLIAKTPEELGLYIKKLSENPIFRKKLGISAQKLALQFTWEKCALEWEKELLKYAKQPLQ